MAGMKFFVSNVTTLLLGWLNNVIYFSSVVITPKLLELITSSIAVLLDSTPTGIKFIKAAVFLYISFTKGNTSLFKSVNVTVIDGSVNAYSFLSISFHLSIFSFTLSKLLIVIMAFDSLGMAFVFEPPSILANSTSSIKS